MRAEPDTPSRLARLLIRLEYGRDAVIATVQDKFPDEKAVPQLVDAAIQQFDQSTAELNRQIKANEAAIAAEHRED